MRENTFWPELCLIQLAGEGVEAIVDPMSDGLDLEPFFELMRDQTTIKVFHAARQDVEIIHHMSGHLPNPIFDTQVAAAVCGFGESVGYSNLVKKILQVEIDKTSRFTDWRRRPLSEKQLTYALGDVTHLCDVYLHLDELLEENGRANWLVEEMSVLTNPATYEQHPDEAWKRLKQTARSPKAFAIMIELAKWRETTAQEKDTPRNRVIKDDVIYDVAMHAPKDQKALANLRTVHDGISRGSKGAKLLEIVARAEKIDPDTLPKMPRKRSPTPETQAVSDLLRVLLKASAAAHGVATKILATSSELDQLAASDNADIPALKGWRRELFGNDALALKHGKLGLVMNDGTITVRRF